MFPLKTLNVLSNRFFFILLHRPKMGVGAVGNRVLYRAALDLYPRHEPAAAALEKIQRR
jgi:hypothetical protein